MNHEIHEIHEEKDCAMSDMIYSDEVYAIQGAVLRSIKHVSNLLPEHSAQLFNYLRGTKMKLGLLVNFGHYPGVEIKRIVI